MTRILLTNDDGISAPGLKALAEELEKEFEVEVVAPDRERSASSHSITFHKPVWVYEIKPRWKAVTGTSVDCVNLAVNKLLNPKPDLVIAGINRGANLGCDIFYSGTVAGAREAGILGLPAFAISIEVGKNSEPDYSYPARFARRFAKFVLENKFPHRLIFNVNFPALASEEIKGFKFTSQGIRVYHPKIWEREDPRGNKYYWLNGEVKGGRDIKGSDILAVEQGYISITPLGLDFTDYQVLSHLREIDPGFLWEK